METPTMVDNISRYIVPFYYDSRQDGYENLIDRCLKTKSGRKTPNGNPGEITEAETGGRQSSGLPEELLFPDSLRLPQDCKWEKKGFWEGKNGSREVDIYPHLFYMLRDEDENSPAYRKNAGTSLLLRLNEKSIKLRYTPASGGEPLDFYLSKVGLLLFRNGIGFLWYDVSVPDGTKPEAYIAFQNDFKEISRSYRKGTRFTRKAGFADGKEIYEGFYMGQWLTDLLSSGEAGIAFWEEREKEVDGKKRQIPDRAVLFQYALCENTDRETGNRLAFRLANGYDIKYHPPAALSQELYMPFDNVGFYTSRSGSACVVTGDDTNRDFFTNNFKSNFCNSYFFIFILLQYQSYTCTYFSRALAGLPSEESTYRKNRTYLDRLEALDSDINLFLVKNTHASVSNVQHHNQYYQYCKKRLLIEEDINSITAGLTALRGIEKEKQKDAEAQKEGRLSKIVMFFTVLTVFSVLADGLALVDRLSDGTAGLNAWHIGSMVCIGIVTVLLIAATIFNTGHKKNRSRTDKK